MFSIAYDVTLDTDDASGSDSSQTFVHVTAMIQLRQHTFVGSSYLYTEAYHRVGDVPYTVLTELRNRARESLLKRLESAIDRGRAARDIMGMGVGK